MALVSLRGLENTAAMKGFPLPDPLAEGAGAKYAYGAIYTLTVIMTAAPAGAAALRPLKE